MTRTAGGKKGRAVAGLIGLAPKRYYSPGRISVLVGCTASRVSEVLSALAESADPKDRAAAKAYRETAKSLGQHTGPDLRHEYERGDAYDLMHTDPRCAVCGMPKRSSHHA